MLLLFTIVLQFLATQICLISSNACLAFSAQMIFAPLFEMLDSKASNCKSSVSSDFHFKFFARCRASSRSWNWDLPAGTTALYFPILKLIFRLWSRSDALSTLLAMKADAFSDMVQM